MFPEGEERNPGTPVENAGRVAIPDTDGWSYLPFEHDEERSEHRVRIVKEDGTEAAFTVPDYVEQGDELGQIARLVIQARERWRELKGLGA